MQEANEMPLDGSDMPEVDASGFLTRLRDAIGQPFTQPVTWPKLALIVGFVLVVMIAWRQVILYATGEK